MLFLKYYAYFLDQLPELVDGQQQDAAKMLQQIINQPCDQQVFCRACELLVQVVKDETGQSISGVGFVQCVL